MFLVKIALFALVRNPLLPVRPYVHFLQLKSFLYVHVDGYVDKEDGRTWYLVRLKLLLFRCLLESLSRRERKNSNYPIFRCEFGVVCTLYLYHGEGNHGQIQNAVCGTQ